MLWLQADSMIYQSEKQLKELGEKVPAETKAKVEAKIATLREALNNDDVESLKSGIEALNQVSVAYCP